MRNIRILSLDGGGMKGLFSAIFMQRFCKDAGINPNQIGDYFDIIAGSSIGAIMGGAYAVGQSPSDMINFFTTQGKNIFTSTWGTPMPAWRKGTLFTTTNFSEGGSFYGDGDDYDEPNTVLETQLQGVFSDTKMFQLKTNLLVTAVEKRQITDNQEVPFRYRPVVFSNLNLSFLEGQSYLVWQAVMASGSAPIYLPPTSITGSPPNVTYVDGGVYQNNPASLELAVANAIYPSVDRICILSVGCGLGTVGFYDTKSTIKAPRLAVSDNFEYLTQILDISGTGAQEAIHKQLELLSFYRARINNADLFYYRFQTIFDPNENTELDNSSPEFLSYMASAANAQYDTDSLKIGMFIQKLAA